MTETRFGWCALPLLSPPQSPGTPTRQADMQRRLELTQLRVKEMIQRDLLSIFGVNSKDLISCSIFPGCKIPTCKGDVETKEAPYQSSSGACTSILPKHLEFIEVLALVRPPIGLCSVCGEVLGGGGVSLESPLDPVQAGVSEHAALGLGVGAAVADVYVALPRRSPRG